MPYHVLVIAVALTVAALLGIAATPAAGQSQEPICTDRGKFLAHLGENYGEAPVAMGLTSGGGMLEVLASGGGSWTIIVTMPGGWSCIVASGESWENDVAVAKAPGSGA